MHAHPDFQLVISYNPGYQSLLKDLKPSTKQRFAAFEFYYPSAELEAQIVSTETELDTARWCALPLRPVSPFRQSQLEFGQTFKAGQVIRARLE